MMQYPVLSTVLAPIYPIARLYFSNPIINIAVFFGLFAGVVNNRNLAWPVRYNAMQAILLDLLLIIPSLLESTFRPPIDSGIGLQLYITTYNSIFLFIFVGVIYAVVRSVTLRTTGSSLYVHREFSVLVMRCRVEQHLADQPALMHETSMRAALNVQTLNLMGQLPRIPLVAQAAEQQVR
jgi:Chloroplast import apparatus Tic20-like